MDWIPTNKLTGRTYPPISDAEKVRKERSPHTQGKFSYAPVKSASKPVTAESPLPKKKETTSKPDPDTMEDPTKTK